MTNHEMLNIYVELLPFLAEACGPGCEVALHDVSQMDHSLIAICNPGSGRTVGDPMTDLGRSVIEQSGYMDKSYISNYRARSKNKEFLSSTFFIKNEGELIGLLCLNRDMTSVKEANSALTNLIEQFGLSARGKDTYYENLESSVGGMIRKRIDEVVEQSGVSPTRMSQEEKIRLLHRLESEGLLNVRGAKREVAEIIGVSVPTVYRYLNIRENK